MKKIYAFLLAVILLFSVLTSVAFAVRPKESPVPVACQDLGEGSNGGGGDYPNIWGSFQTGSGKRNW